MALLNWDRKRYSVAVPALDDQHAVFIDSLNRLHAAMINGRGKAITGPLLQTLSEYAHSHCATEEELMAAANYPGLAQHRVTHQEFAAKLEELKTIHEHGEIAVCIPLLQFMRDWISTHILDEDRKYTPWLNRNNGR